MRREILNLINELLKTFPKNCAYAEGAHDALTYLYNEIKEMQCEDTHWKK